MVVARLAVSDGNPARSRSRGRPTQDTVAQIDREILDAAREQFFRYGYAGTSMAMVVKAACVSKTTLYARYSNKTDLFQATVRLTLDQLAQLVRMPSNRIGEDLVTGLIEFGLTALRISSSPLWANYERLVYAEGPQFPELTELVGVRVNVGIESVAVFIADCAERDAIPCRDPEAIATVYVMAIRGFYSAAVLRVRELTAEESDRFVRNLVDKLVAGRADW